MPTNISRRSLLGWSLAAAGGLLATGEETAQAAGKAYGNPRPGSLVMPDDPIVQHVENLRPHQGRGVMNTLTSQAQSVTIEGRQLPTWGYNGLLPGPTLRARVGDTLHVRQINDLQEATSTHFHGLALRNNADGVPDVTQPAIAPGSSFQATFRLSHPGTYWYHSHQELQRDRALYGALIVEDPHEPLGYDHEWVLVIDDWLDGIDGRTPEKQAAELMSGMSGGSGMSGMSGGFGMSGMSGGSGMSGMSGGSGMSGSPFLGGDGGDVSYPLNLINGHGPADPDTFRAKPGQRVRLRIINAGGDTAYRVGIPGHKLTITHTDGYPVRHRDVDAIVLGMGERADAIITVPDSPVPVVALAEGKSGHTYAVLTPGTGSVSASSIPQMLDGQVISSASLTADPSVTLPSRPVDVRHTLKLTGSMANYNWGINGIRYDPAHPFANSFPIRQGQRVQIDFTNATMMWHPIHLHGHTFQVGQDGPRKDTVIVKPMETVSIFFDADNPGQWLTHCHNAYHAAAGMMAVVSYVH